MKSIEQLLQLSKNQYYTLSDEEQAQLDAFLLKRSGQSTSAKKSTDDSEKNIPATVLNKNVVAKETGKIPTINNIAKADSKEVLSDNA